MELRHAPHRRRTWNAGDQQTPQNHGNRDRARQRRHAHCRLAELGHAGSATADQFRASSGDLHHRRWLIPVSVAWFCGNLLNSCERTMSRRNPGGHKSPISADSLAPALLLVAKAGLLVFAFVLTWYSGHRGLFLLDHSIAFDGAWRILQGQVPYRDFYMAFPPLMFWIQAVFLRVAGLTFSSMVLSAAVVNLLARPSIIGM